MNNTASFDHADLVAIFGTAAADLPRSIQVTGISTDSRTLKPGNAFIALKGERFDGHDFASDAVRSGATALLTDHRLDDLDGSGGGDGVITTIEDGRGCRQGDIVVAGHEVGGTRRCGHGWYIDGDGVVDLVVGADTVVGLGMQEQVFVIGRPAEGAATP